MIWVKAGRAISGEGEGRITPDRRQGHHHHHSSFSLCSLSVHIVCFLCIFVCFSSSRYRFAVVSTIGLDGRLVDRNQMVAK